jgi:hypothetical protein
MIFLSDTPSLYVKISNKYIQRATGKKGLYFDANSEYETENPVLIKVMSQMFAVKAQVAEVQEIPESIKPPVKIRRCHKCGFESENYGGMMAHYRLSHPKEGK